MAKKLKFGSPAWRAKYLGHKPKKEKRVVQMAKRRRSHARSVFRKVRRSRAGRSAGGIMNKAANFGVGLAAGTAVANTLKTLPVPVVPQVAPFVGAGLAYYAGGKGMTGIAAAGLTFYACGGMDAVKPLLNSLGSVASASSSSSQVVG